MGRTSFTGAEIDELRRLIREKADVGRLPPETLRARMRRMNFDISDILFASREGIIPAPESSHAIHGALEAVRRRVRASP